MENTTFLHQKCGSKFVCQVCDFKCSKKGDYKRHIDSKKHKKVANQQNTTELQPNLHHCDCGKTYTHRGSLHNHKKKCTYISTESIQDIGYQSDIDYKGLLMVAMKQMVEQQAQIKEQHEIMEKMIQNVGNNNTTNNTTNNNHFNINLFLNEQCKDAINFSDFIDNIEVSHDDLENSANSGFVNGITKILVDNLKQLTLYERPIHCTDVKRETIYIKDNDKWEKDQEQTTNKLNGAIREVSRKGLCSLMQWKQDNPDYEDGNSEFSNRCIIIQQQIMPGYNRDKYYPRVVHNLAKESAIEKSQKG